MESGVYPRVICSLSPAIVLRPSPHRHDRSQVQNAEGQGRKSLLCRLPEITTVLVPGFPDPGSPRTVTSARHTSPVLRALFVRAGQDGPRVTCPVAYAFFCAPAAVIVPWVASRVRHRGSPEGCIQIVRAAVMLFAGSIVPGKCFAPVYPHSLIVSRPRYLKRAGQVTARPHSRPPDPRKRP